MKHIKPTTLAICAAISLLFTVSVFAQPTAPEAPTVVVDGGAATDAATPGKTPEAPEAKAPAEDTKAEAPPNPAAADTAGFAKEVWAKYKSREWLPLVGGILLMLVFVFRKFASKISPFFDTKKGGYVVNFSTAGGLTVGLALWADAMSLGVISIAIGSAIVAGGGYEHLRDFVGSIFGGKDDKEADAS